MIYMVEQDFAVPALLAGWNEWYESYIRRLITVPGFISGQRFQSVIPAVASFAAIYTLRDAGVMSSPQYIREFGPDAVGSWRQHMTNWHRNRFEGVDAFDEVPQDECLAVLDRLSDDAPVLHPAYAGMKPTGLDCSVAERGLMRLDDMNKLVHHGQQAGTVLRIMKPMGPMLRGPSPRIENKE